MGKSREIKKRMKAVGNIKRITRTMQMIATSKFAKAQPAATMSGGEARMLAIARGLMSNAKFLAIDEPSLGLQPNLRDEVARIIQSINAQGMTVLVVEQNIPQITELASRIYVLEEGRISFEGSREAALGNDHLKEIFLGM